MFKTWLCFKWRRNQWIKKKDNYLNQNSEKSNQYLKTLENIDDLIVKGKNLYNLEYKREIIDSKNNKILHKVFMENGKVISLAEVNKIYKNDIFYKDYNSSNNEQKEGKKFWKNIFKISE